MVFFFYDTGGEKQPAAGRIRKTEDKRIDAEKKSMDTPTD